MCVTDELPNLDAHTEKGQDEKEVTILFRYYYHQVGQSLIGRSNIGEEGAAIFVRNGWMQDVTKCLPQVAEGAE